METTLTDRIIDSYTACLAGTPGIDLQKAILRASKTDHGSNSTTKDRDTWERTSHSAPRSRMTVHILEDLTRLPNPDSSIQIISARSLHKGVRYASRGSHNFHCMPSSSERDIKACLLEASRVLVTGGYLEYIYFESDLVNPGPLTAELEDYLWGTWNNGYDASTVSLGDTCHRDVFADANLPGPT